LKTKTTQIKLSNLHSTPEGIVNDIDASTHKSAKTHTGNVFVIRDLDG